MTDHPNLAAALAAVQRQLPDVRKGEVAHVRSDKGSYSYSYADLADVSKAILPLLGDNGLAWITRPTLLDGVFCLMYALVHVSGEKIEGVYPLPANGSPQMLGSAITYGRRYTLCAVTGVAADQDDDGAAASKDTRGRQNAREGRAQRAGQPLPGYDANDPGAIKRAAREQLADDDPDDGPLTLTDRQSKKLHTLLTAAGYSDRDEKLAVIASVIGRDIVSSKELSRFEAAQVIRSLEMALDDRHVEDPA